MTALLIQLISCAWMTGLIWVIQILHYPCFSQIGEAEFIEFHARHTQRITYLVAPLMTVELLTGFSLMWDSQFQPWLTVNFTIIVLIWLSTAALSVPLHNQLATHKNPKIIQRLVLTNWPRTLLWSLRLAIMTVYCLSQLQKSSFVH